MPVSARVKRQSQEAAACFTDIHMPSERRGSAAYYIPYNLAFLGTGRMLSQELRAMISEDIGQFHL